jgi:tRNA uridine 5-carboxymethylaminomethyl modification enzyme
VNAALQAGAPAAQSAEWGKDIWVPGRNEAYLGVLVDDLITKGVTEPYRMFTSRAEFRLQLREDNADMRLTEAGHRMGLVGDAQWDSFCRKREAVSRETERLKSTWVNPRNLPADEAARVLGKAIEHEHNLFDLLRRPDVDYAGLTSMDGGRFASEAVAPQALGELSAPVIEQVEIAAKYAGYIDRQIEEVQRAVHLEGMKLPANLDYMQVTALSIEARQTLTRLRPETLGLASRISGITPASISLLMIHLKKGGFKGFATTPREVLTDESLA